MAGAIRTTSEMKFGPLVTCLTHVAVAAALAADEQLHKAERGVLTARLRQSIGSPSSDGISIVSLCGPGTGLDL